MDEAQSTFRSESTAPSFIGLAIQAYIDKSFKKVVETLEAREDEHLKGLVETMGRSFIYISETQAQTLKEVAALRKEVNYLQEIVLEHISTQFLASSISDSLFDLCSSPTSHNRQNSPTPTELLESDPSITLSPPKPIPVLPPISVPPHIDSSFLFPPPDPTLSQSVPIILVSSSPDLTPLPTQPDLKPQYDSTPILQLTLESPTDYHSIFHPDTPPILQLFPDEPTFLLMTKREKNDKAD